MSDLAGAPERYFYHSFPRRARDKPTEVEIGCTVLEIIRDSGLVMAPEAVEWQYEHEDGSPPRTSQILQRRVSFTELAPYELARHAKKFGHFALEFEVPVLKSLGAIPVFYIPRALSEAKGAEGAASTLVMQFLDAMVLVERIAKAQEYLRTSGQASGTFSRDFGFQNIKTFQLDAGATTDLLDAFMHALTPSSTLLNAMRGMTNFYFPADDQKHDEVLGYYREREWRIAGAMTRGQDLVFSPSPNLEARLIALDPEFFGKEYPPGSGQNRAEQSYVMPGLGETPVIDMARRIIVPADAVGRVQKIVKGCSAEVIALESIASECVR